MMSQQAYHVRLRECLRLLLARRAMPVNAVRIISILQVLEETHAELEDMDRETLLSTRIILEKHRGLLEKMLLLLPCVDDQRPN